MARAGRSRYTARMAHSTARLTENALQAWGERVGREARPPLVLALRGDLGAGKSTLARAVARGMGIAGPVPSPTFNLLFRYTAPSGVQLVHIDLYRLEEQTEVWALGWAELPASDEVVVVEWPERAERLLPEPRWEIEIEDEGDPEARGVSAHPIGDPPPLPPF